MENTAPEQKAEKKSSTASECAAISEKQFMWDHTLYSAASSWLFAIAGATNIGVLSVLASKFLTAAEQGLPFFRSKDGVTPVMGNKKYNRIVLGMTAFGGLCMCISNWLESKKVVTEWQLGVNKMQRTANVAEQENARKSPPNPSLAPISAAKTSPMEPSVAPSQPRQWRTSMQSRMSHSMDRAAQHLRIGK